MTETLTKAFLFAEAQWKLVEGILADLREQSSTYVQIANKYGVSVTTVGRIAKFHGITRPRGVKPKKVKPSVKD